jgi:N-acetylmuramoyl-L-alanine amidase
MGYISASYTVHGHNDGTTTTCPGEAVYNHIRSWPHFGGALKKC